MSDDFDPIEVLLYDLLPLLQGFDRLDRKWFAETLLDEMGFAHGIGAHDDAVENVRDVGEGLVITVALAAQQHPERIGDVCRAAHRVLVDLLEVVQEALFGRDAPEDGGVPDST